MARLTLLLLAAVAASTNAYTVIPQRASGFVGRDVSHAAPTTTARGINGARATLEMKKGKANVSPQMRQQYKRAQAMEEYRKEMQDSQMMGADGLPVFNLYVRTPMKNMWYPCGSFKGDEKSAALCQSYAEDGMMAGISKNQLDSGVGGSLFRDMARLEETIIRGYPQLRKDKGKLEWGYKLSYKGLSKEQEKVHIVKIEEYRKEMQDSQMMGADGLPVFNLYVRTPMKNMWYPCGSFKGDEKSAALCQSYAEDGMMAGISKNQLDSGVGGSLFRDMARLEETIIRGYPQLRKDKGQLEWGYKLSYKGLSKEQEKVHVVKIEEQKGWFDGIKNAFSGN